jgi:hypothetical protein
MTPIPTVTKMGLLSWMAFAALAQNVWSLAQAMDPPSSVDAQSGSFVISIDQRAGLPPYRVTKGMR